jgi:hypothetical protein
MIKLNTSLITSTLLVGFLLVGCGGGPNSPLNNNAVSSGGAGSAGGGNSSSEPDTTSPQKIGFGSGDTFANGVIGVSVGSGNQTLSAGGTSTLTVNIVSDTNSLVTNEINITFNSRCLAAREATLTNNAGTSVTSISTENGEASLKYTAAGCVGADLITATATLGTSVRTATATINVAPDTVQSITFVDAVPTQLSLKGTGGIETSLVRFKVSGSTGAALKDVDVVLALNTTVGGLCLADPASSSTCAAQITAKTDNNGIASATVQSGSIPTPIRITATVTAANISTQSNGLFVATGLPDQDSMSLSVATFNPRGWNVDGTKVALTIRMADAFNNPPPKDTAVTFITEGGKIDPGCTTDADGQCTVQWTSQEPKPLSLGSLPGQRAGRVTILATAQGNESFDDLDGDGFYSTVDSFAPNKDLDEAFLDKDENNIYDAANEAFVDFDKNGSRTAKNGIYNGILCKTEGAGCTKTGVNVRASAVIAMSSDFGNITLLSQSGATLTSATVPAGQTVSFVRGHQWK